MMKRPAHFRIWTPPTRLGSVSSEVRGSDFSRIFALWVERLRSSGPGWNARPVSSLSVVLHYWGASIGPTVMTMPDSRHKLTSRGLAAVGSHPRSRAAAERERYADMATPPGGMPPAPQ